MRHDWPRLKAAYLAGDFQSVAEWGRARGLNPVSNNFRRQTRGWRAERDTLVQGAVQDAGVKIRETLAKELAEASGNYTHAHLLLSRRVRRECESGELPGAALLDRADTVSKIVGRNGQLVSVPDTGHDPEEFARNIQSALREMERVTAPPPQ